MMHASRLRALAAAIFVLASAAAGSNANAATSTGTLSVTSAVISVCAVGNGTVAFGQYDPTTTAAATTTGTFVLTCTPGTTYDIGMGPGAGTGANVATRQMTGGTKTLGYQLFRDVSHTQNWGQTVGFDTLHGTSSATTISTPINVYGVIPANQPVSIGAYADVVTVTLTY